MIIPIGDDNPTKAMPWVTYLLVAFNTVLFLSMYGMGPEAAEEFHRRYSLLPAHPSPCALITYAFLHASVLHLVFNMLFLHTFGDNVEDSFGSIVFLAFYLGGAMVGGVSYMATHTGGNVPCVGASGAVSAVLGAYVVLYPGKDIRVLVWPFGVYGVKAVWFIGFWFLLQMALFTFEVVSSEPTIAYSAHAGGFVFGLLVAGGLQLTCMGIPAETMRRDEESRRRRTLELARQTLPEPEAAPPPPPGGPEERIATVEATEPPTEAKAERPGQAFQAINPLTDDRVHTDEELLSDQKASLHEGEKFSVIRSGGEEVDLSDIVPIIAAVAERPKADVSREIRKSHGVLLSDADMATAQCLVSRLKPRGIATLTICQDRLIALPPALSAVRIGFDDKEFRAQAGTDLLAAPWASLVIAASGWIEQGTAKPLLPLGNELGLPRGVLDGMSQPWFTPHVTVPVGPKRVWVVDLVFVNPWRRVRFQPEETRFHLTPLPAGGPMKMVQLMIEKIIPHADNGAVNVVLHDLYDKGRRLPSGRFTFGSFRELDSYVSWLLQVKAFGGDIRHV